MSLDEKIANALMTPYQAYKGMKKVPIELIWAIKQLIKDEVEDALDKEIDERSIYNY